MVTVRIPKPDETHTAKGERLFLVERDGVVVGFISKLRNTRTDFHPWRVFECAAPSNFPRPATLLTVFYTQADARALGPDFQRSDAKLGGKAAAVAFARTHFQAVTHA
jgi:hypothetical protein